MKRNLKHAGIVTAVLLCALPFALGPTRGSAPSAEAGEATARLTVLVEAFVVEVDLAALARLDVNPIGAAPDAVSVAHISRCLDTDDARVVAGAKMAARLDSEGEVGAKCTRHFTIETVRQGRTVSASTTYESGTELSVRIAAARETELAVSYALSCNVFDPPAPTPDARPDTMSWTWSGRIELAPGRPAIAAATQNREQAVFLILTAHPQG